jgi:hypothetical protein
VVEEVEDELVVERDVDELDEVEVDNRVLDEDVVVRIVEEELDEVVVDN